MGIDFTEIENCILSEQQRKGRDSRRRSRFSTPYLSLSLSLSLFCSSSFCLSSLSSVQFCAVQTEGEDEDEEAERRREDCSHPSIHPFLPFHYLPLGLCSYGVHPATRL